MKKSFIHLDIELDQSNLPERIQWDASGKPEPGPSDTKAMSVALWDPQQKNTLRIDLWTKDMPVLEMKQFYIECLAGIAQNTLKATSDEFMAAEINALCERLVKHLRDTQDKG
jgi:gliding motility-associated protein GldC